MSPKAATPLPPVDPASELLAQADSRTARFEVSEVNPGTGRPDYIEPVDIEAVRALGLHEFLRQRYCLGGHGGTFQVRIRKRSGTYGQSVSVPIAGDSNIPRDRAGAQAPAAGVAAPVMGGGANPWVDRLLVPIGITLATTLATLIAKKLVDGPAASEDGTEKALKLLKLVREAQPANGANDPNAVFALVEKTMELQNTLLERANASDRGGRREGGGMIGLVECVGGRVVNLLERKMQIDEQRAARGAARATATVAGDRGATSAGAEGGAPGASSREAPPSTASTDPLVAMFESLPFGARKMLHHWAKSGLDPEQYADVVLDQFDDATYAAMVDELDRPEFVDVLIATIPAYAPERAWFAELVVAMRASVRLANAAEGVSSRDTAVHVDTPTATTATTPGEPAGVKVSA